MLVTTLHSPANITHRCLNMSASGCVKPGSTISVPIHVAMSVATTNRSFGQALPGWAAPCINVMVSIPNGLIHNTSPSVSTSLREMKVIKDRMNSGLAATGVPRDARVGATNVRKTLPWRIYTPHRCCKMPTTDLFLYVCHPNPSAKLSSCNWQPLRLLS
ncbi:unnamed protein product [Hydatigera taeniaeformis]|uniref:Uncharacterized protein n=1 Tax=Hydatigena taeniaeformis TaxID=6205 RepID=A0A0R3WVT8_HYDTA|nr:unnamed protein product [Hydatigera taeniaeformis]